MKKITFIIPCYNAAKNIEKLYLSLFMQTDKEWHAIFVNDMSIDETIDTLNKIKDERVTIVDNKEKKFALRNIYDSAISLEDHEIVAIIDGDDQLCNSETVEIIKKAHDKNDSVVWTAHKWDINGMNVSGELPQNVNPYQYQWRSSHLRSFDSSLLKCLNVENFFDHNRKWFERGYDQALMLPLLHEAKVRKYIPEVCYLYNINSCSMPNRDWTERKQLSTVNFIRARGFIK